MIRHKSPLRYVWYRRIPLKSTIKRFKEKKNKNEAIRPIYIYDKPLNFIKSKKALINQIKAGNLEKVQSIFSVMRKTYHSERYYGEALVCSLYSTPEILDYIFSTQEFYLDYALNYACYIGDKNAIDFLISKGANNLNDALINACAGESLVIVDKMYQLGADITEDALIEACGNDNVNIVIYLLQENPDLPLNRAFIVSCENCIEDDTLRVLTYKGDISKDILEQGLISASSHGNLSAVIFLIDRVSIEILSDALSISARLGIDKIVKYLVFRRTEISKELTCLEGEIGDYLRKMYRKRNAQKLLKILVSFVKNREVVKSIPYLPKIGVKFFEAKEAFAKSK